MRSPRRTPMLTVLLLAACSQSPVEPPEMEVPTGTLRLTLTTTGPGAVDALRLLVDDGPPASVGANTALELTLTPGIHTVQVEVPGHCSGSRYAPLEVEIEADGLRAHTWSVDCPAPVSPGLYFTRWTEAAGQRIMRANLDGTGAMPLATPVTPERAALNPSRTRLAFLADNPDYGRLWMANADGSNPVSTGLHVTDFDWSPDGRMLVATTLQDSPRTALALYWPDGSLIRTLHEAAGYSSVRWAPTGTRVAVKEAHYLYIYDVENGTRTNTLQLIGPSEQPVAWSPDGTRVAYVHDGRLWSMNADGSDLTELQDDAGPEGVDWSPTGTLIFTRSRFVQSHESVLFTVTSDGGSLSESPAYLAGALDDRPRWAP